MRKPMFPLMIAAIVLSKLSSALAQYPLHVQFHLTATVQEPFSGVFPQTFREKVVTIDNRKLLALLGAATTNDFTGAELVVDHSGIGFSVVRGTNTLADVSALLSRQGATGTFVVRGTEISDTTSNTTFNVERKTVQQYNFGTADHSFVFWALEKAKIIWTMMDTNAPPQYFERSTSYGFGDGLWDSRPAVFRGTVEVLGPTARSRP